MQMSSDMFTYIYIYVYTHVDFSPYTCIYVMHIYMYYRYIYIHVWIYSSYTEGSLKYSNHEHNNPNGCFQATSLQVDKIEIPKEIAHIYPYTDP